MLMEWKKAFVTMDLSERVLGLKWEREQNGAVNPKLLQGYPENMVTPGSSSLTTQACG